jgi:hypothetical protein
MSRWRVGGLPPDPLSSPFPFPSLVHLYLFVPGLMGSWSPVFVCAWALSFCLCWTCASLLLLSMFLPLLSHTLASGSSFLPSRLNPHRHLCLHSALVCVPCSVVSIHFRVCTHLFYCALLHNFFYLSWNKYL